MHHPSSDTPQSFYGLKILFSAYSHVFDDLLYDDEAEDLLESPDDEKSEKENCQLGLDFDDEKPEKSSMKTLHLHNIHPKAFEYLYDVFLGATIKLPIDEMFAGKVVNSQLILAKSHPLPSTAGTMKNNNS